MQKKFFLSGCVAAVRAVIHHYLGFSDGSHMAMTIVPLLNVVKRAWYALRNFGLSLWLADSRVWQSLLPIPGILLWSAQWMPNSYWLSVLLLWGIGIACFLVIILVIDLLHTLEPTIELIGPSRLRAPTRRSFWIYPYAVACMRLPDLLRNLWLRFAPSATVAATDTPAGESLQPIED